MLALAPLAILSVGGALTLQAQDARGEADRGIAAFHVLDFEGSVRTLRRVLEAPATPAMTDSARAHLLGFVGAGELLLGRPGEAAIAFREALFVAPEFRLDTLTFPPAVSTAFEAARGTTAFVAARAARESSFVPGEGSFRIRLTSSAPHAIRTGICEPGGGRVRTLFDGAIADSLWLAWDGLIGSGTAAPAGRVELCVESVGSDGAVHRLRLPIRVVGGTAPERRTAPIQRSSRWRAVLVGVVAASAAIALPEVVATGDDWSSRRYVVGGTLLAASLLAPPRPVAPGGEGATPRTPRGPIRVSALEPRARSQAP